MLQHREADKPKKGPKLMTNLTADLPHLFNGGIVLLALILATCWWFVAVDRTDR